MQQPTATVQFEVLLEAELPGLEVGEEFLPGEETKSRVRAADLPRPLLMLLGCWLRAQIAAVLFLPLRFVLCLFLSSEL